MFVPGGFKTCLDIYIISPLVSGMAEVSFTLVFKFIKGIFENMIINTS